ncbi:MAG: D-glucuronyl C5-epimerase family protein [Arachnia sp.]
MSSQRTHRRFLPLLVAVLLGLTGAVVQLPQTAAAEEGHPYTTPGQREYNGRLWNTTCEQYSSTAERCRAEIFATQVKLVDGKYQFVNGFAFNNLTYLPSNRDNWKDNPLAKTGQFIQDGRMWQTECNTEWTGKNGCRSFIFASVIEPTKTATGWSFAKVDKWLFNNVVQFTPVVSTPPPPGPKNPCNIDPPAGWTFTSDGRPHLIKPGYEPADHYNPISLANFTKLALRMDPKKVKEADRLCFALLGANKLMEKAETRTYEGRESLWFPYPFGFSANPAVDDLPAGWNSGLGQAGAMTAMLELSKFVGELDKPASERTWENVAKEIYNSYLIPLGKGGFTNRDNGFLWFEEYPTTPEPTVVNNGHHQNVLALYAYWQRTDDPEALALFDEAVVDMGPQTIKSEVPLEGGTMSSYDLLRGYQATPLRAVSVDNATITHTLLNGEALTAYPDNKPRHDKNTVAATLPLGSRSGAAIEMVTNPHMNGVVNKVPAGWRAVNGNVEGLRGPDNIGMIGVHPNGRAWAGLEQIIPAASWTSKAAPGSRLSMAMNSRLQIDPGTSGTGGKVSIYSVCPAPGNKTTTSLLLENPKNRSQNRVSWSTADFTAPAANCDIKIQLLTYSYGVNNTTAWYDDVTLSAADPLGPNVAPAYDLLVHRTPTNTLTIKGSGKVTVEAYYGGRWLKFAEGTLTAAGLNVTVPERYTGRNINYNYHDGHISELQLISCYSGDKSLDQIAKRWSAMATKPYRDFSNNQDCKQIPLVLDMGGNPVFVEAEPAPMTEVPKVMPTTMALPEDDS